MTIEIKVKENDILNINGVNFTFYNGKLVEVEVENKNIVFPACFGLVSSRTCGIYCIYKSKCSDILDQMERFAKHVPSGYVKLKPAEPVQDCFGSFESEDSLCIQCVHSCTCSKAYDMVNKAKNDMVNKTPICFSTKPDSPPCTNCSHSFPCKKAYEKVEKAKKLSMDEMLESIADVVSKNMKDPLEVKSFCTCETSCTYKLHETQRDNSVS